MKTLSLLIALFIGTLVSPSQTITVTVENVLNEKGKVIVALHTSETFMKGPGIQTRE